MINQELLTNEETQIAQMVRVTIQAATQPAPGQLQKLMPTPPHPKSVAQPWHAWQRQLAAVATCVFLLLSGLSVYYARQNYGGYTTTAPTLVSVTATTTNEPTSTIAQTNENRQTQLIQTAVATHPSLAPAIISTPSPNPTPIAALMPLLSSN